MNEFEEICGQYLVQGTGHEELEGPIAQKLKTYELNNLPPIQYYYSDNCCHDRPFFTSRISSLRVGIQKLPMLPLPEKIIEVKSQIQDRAMREHAFSLLSDPDCEIGELCPVGFDIEYVAHSGPRDLPIGTITVIQVSLPGNPLLYYFIFLISRRVLHLQHGEA